MNQVLAKFYQGHGADNRGRYLVDILDWDDSQWEHSHDSIQWVFPLKEASAFNPRAPLLDDGIIEENIVAAVARAEAFLGAYGLVPKPPWLKPGNHNMLRVTRILKFMNLVGMHKKAVDLFGWLEGLSAQYPAAVPTKTMTFWREALS